MSYNIPPPYATGSEEKGFIPPDQQQQPPGGYYPQQPQPMMGPPPGQTAVTYYPPSGPPQQQPQQLVITQPAPVIVQTQHVESYVMHIVLSCITLWCCGCLFGLIAFILAMVAQSRAVHSPNSARSYGKASIVVSIVGIVLAILVVILGVVLSLVGVGYVAHQTSQDVMSSLQCRYRVYGNCYQYRTRVSSSLACSGYYRSPYCYKNMY